MTKIWGNYIVLLLFFLAGSGFLFSQDEKSYDHANKLFEKEKYVDCKQDFLQLISLDPRNSDLNFKYGVCLLYSDNEKSNALRYLKFAVTDPSIDPRAFFFIGKAHHLNYNFSEAKKWYQKYTSTKNPKEKKIDEQQAITQCENGQKLLQSFTDLVVSEKKQIVEKDFFRLYDNMQSIGGQILVAERFQSKLDKKKGHIPLVHFPENARAVFYASYGENDENGLDIFTRKRLPDGSWGESVRLSEKINTPYDDNFPFLHSSGDYLFFSSKGHNSMGGYDIFSSTKNFSTGEFDEVKNVDFAISSPDDDLFYVVDKAFENAYFASARQSEQGKLHVYNVKVTRVPLKEVIVKGYFISEINPDNKNMLITITDETSNQEIGKIKSNQKGDYSFVFPNEGKYKYSIQIEGKSKPIEFTFDLPKPTEFRPLKQKVIHRKEGDKEIFQVVNLFDKKIDGGENLIAEIIRKKAQLDVNIDNFDPKELEKNELASKRNEILADLGFKNKNLSEISIELEQRTQEQKLLQERLDQVQAVGQSKQLDFAEKIIELSQNSQLIQQKIDKSDEIEEKKKLLQQLSEIQNKIQDNNQKLNDTQLISGDQLREELNVNSNIHSVVEQFNQLNESGKEDEAIQLLVENKSKIVEQKNLNLQGALDGLIQRKEELSSKIDSEKKTIQENKAQISQSKTAIKNLENNLKSAKKKEIASIEIEIDQKKDEIDVLETYNLSKEKNISAFIEKENKLDVTIDALQMDAANVDFPNQTELENILSKAKKIVEEQKNNSVENQLAQLNSDSNSSNTEEQAKDESEKDETIYKSIILQEINPDYSSVKEWFESVESPSNELIYDQISLEENNQEKIKKELQKAAVSTKKRYVLSSLLTESEDRITELKQQKTANESIVKNDDNPLETGNLEKEEKEDFAINQSKLLKKFTAQIKQINESELSDFQKEIEIHKINEQKLNFIKTQIDEIEDENEKASWEMRLMVQENENLEKEQELLSRVFQENHSDFINSIDKDYQTSIQNAESIQEKIAIKKNHSLKLQEQIHSEENTFDQKIENSILRNEIKNVKDRIQKLNEQKSEVESISADEIIAETKEKNRVKILSKSEIEEMKSEEIEMYVQQLETYKSELSVQKEKVENTAEKEKINQEVEKIEEIQKNAQIVVEELKQASIENDLAEETKISDENESKSNIQTKKQLLSELKNSSINPNDKALIENNFSEIQSLENQIQKSKSEEEKAFLQEEIDFESQRMSEIIELENEKSMIQNFESKNNVQIETVESLKKRRRKAMIFLGDLEQKLAENLEKQEKSKKKRELNSLKEKETSIAQSINQKEIEIQQLEKQIKTISEQKINVFEDAISQEVSFKEERDIAATENYKQYFSKASEVVKLQKELNRLEVKKVTLQNQIQLELKNGVEVMPEKISRLKTIDTEIENKKKLLQSANEEANTILSISKEEIVKMKNLAFRKIQPIETFQSALEVIEMPRSGFEIDKSASAKSSYSDKNPIPVDVKSPEGLVYRVQVGAFSKPIPQDLFREFTPVSGEKIGNTGITRYMAGFFNSSEVVVKAREDIRSLGYSDAFVVAYCDGNRISFGEARKREQEGTCTSKKMNELVLEIAEKTAVKQGVKVKKEVQEVSEYAYARVPGAVDSDPIELIKGLFFTVQVGAYYRPVGSKTLFNLPEIKSYRAPNGMIKYCTGIFDSPKNARPRQIEARNAGIIGPFIVAYLNGKRISIAEAKKVLTENPTVLYKNQEQETQKMEGISSIKLEKETIIDEIPKVVQPKFYQLISQDKISIYPEKWLSRLNEKGDFYFDEKENRVKSSIFTTQKNGVSGFDFKEVDPLTISENLIIVLESDFVRGDLMDWFLRQNALKRIKTIEGKKYLTLSEVNPSDVDKINLEIQSFDVNYVWK